MRHILVSNICWKTWSRNHIYEKESTGCNKIALHSEHHILLHVLQDEQERVLAGKLIVLVVQLFNRSNDNYLPIQVVHHLKQVFLHIEQQFLK